MDKVVGCCFSGETVVFPARVNDIGPIQTAGKMGPVPGSALSKVGIEIVNFLCVCSGDTWMLNQVAI